MPEDNIKKLPVGNILTGSISYFISKPKEMLVFSLLNFVSVLIGVHTWRTFAFFVLLIFAYAFWCYFFRFYFDKKPYFQLKSMGSSVAPSTKILFLSFVVMTLLILFPFALPFLGLGEADYYLKFLSDKETVDTVSAVVGIFFAPFLFFRPFFAWIGSVLGRNGNLRFAMQKSRGNYWQIVALLLILNIPFVMIEQICRATNAPEWGLYFLLSPLIVFTNLVIARSYEFFFMED